MLCVFGVLTKYDVHLHVCIRHCGYIQLLDFIRFCSPKKVDT